ncbi:MAG: LuxR C-terminal-related transcriptional regulator [Ktedonobacterales bacterium]
MGGAATHHENELVLDVLQIPEAAFAVNANQQIVAWNDEAERLLGYRAEEVLGYHCYHVLVSAHREDCDSCRYRCIALAKAQRTRANPIMETQVATNDGATKWISLSTLTAHTVDGQMRIIHLLHDVTEHHHFNQTMSRILPQQEWQATTGAVSAHAADGGSPSTSSPSDAPALSSSRNGRPMASHVTLTPRELEVLRLLACGLATDEIAKSLSISRVTARNHVNKVLDKMGVNSRLQAVVMASQINLI